METAAEAVQALPTEEDDTNYGQIEQDPSLPSEDRESQSSRFMKDSIRLKMRHTWNQGSWIPEFLSVRYLLEVNNPLLIWNAYTFQWLQWGPCSQSGNGIISKTAGQMQNIALLSALLLTLWTSLVFNTEDKDDTWEGTAVLCCALGGMTFHFLSMINSTILIMLFDELSEDADAFRFSLKIGINTITPVIQLYLGGICGIT